MSKRAGDCGRADHGTRRAGVLAVLFARDRLDSYLVIGQMTMLFVGPLSGILQAVGTNVRGLNCNSILSDYPYPEMSWYGYANVAKRLCQPGQRKLEQHIAGLVVRQRNHQSVFRIFGSFENRLG